MRLPPRAALLAAVLSASGCAPAVLAPCDPPIPPGPVAWVVDYGWHTEIVIPVAQASGALATVRTLFPAARTLSFGFGKTAFMTIPDPALPDFLAGTIPGPATVRVIALPAEPGALYNDPVTQIPLSPAEATALTDFLARAIDRDPNGNPRPAAPDPDRNTRFFQATRGYTLAYTCNAWSADALAQAGLPTHGTILFASGMMGAVARIQGACNAQRTGVAPR